MEAPSEKFLRLHPLTLIHRVFISIIAFGYTWVGVAISDSPQTGMITGVIIASALLIITAPYAIANFIRFRYYATSEELIIFYGVFKRVRRHIPAERIQNVAIERTLLSRILGTASVKIETAGTDKAEGNLSYIGAQEAQRLKNLLQTSKQTVSIEEESRELPSFRMPLNRVVVSSIYQFSLGISAFLSTTLFQLDSMGVLSIETTIVSIIENGFLSDITDFLPWLTVPIILTLIIIAIIVLGWLSGFILNFIRFYNFSMVLGPTKIQRRFGLLRIQEGSLSYKRVQSFLIRSNPLMQLRRWYRLELQTLGFQSGRQGFQPAMPFARWSEITTLAPQIRPFTLPETYTSVSSLMIQRFSIRYSGAAVLILTILSLAWSTQVLWGLCLLPVGWWIALLQYQRHNWAFHDGNLFVQRRILSQQFWIIPVERFQAFKITSSFFQRRLGLCTLVVDTAGAGVIRYPRIIDLRQDDAQQLLDLLYSAFQSSERKSSSDIGQNHRI